MNGPIRRVAVVAMLMFALLLANGTYIVLFRQGPLDAMPQNRRVRDAEFSQNRGSILAAGKTEIATTVPSKDRFAYQRNYPAGSLYAPVTGYFSYDHASTGLENTYNTQLAGTADAQSAAYRVGYQSVSQFSREYARMFGAPPIRDVEALRNA